MNVPSPAHHSPTAKPWVTIAAALLAIASCDAASTTHLVNAQTLVAQLRAQGEAGVFFDANGVEYNLYGAPWSSSYISWTVPASVHAVCSNFYIRLMMASYAGWTAKGVGFTSSSPNSAAIHDAIEAGACRYVKVANFADCQPGDVMAIKYFDDASSNSGHTMILEGATPNLTYADGSIRWSVKVVDCSSGPHSNDTRVFPSRTSSGAGSGFLYVYSRNGAVTGYSWKQTSGSTVYAPAVRHLTVGRLTF